MAEADHDKHPLKRDGTGQDHRFLDALDPGKVKLHDLTMEDWLGFARNYARYLNFFDENDETTPAGDWQAFFSRIAPDEDHRYDPESEADREKIRRAQRQLDNFVTETERKEGQIEPHLALFIAFLKVLQRSRDHINTLTSRHLDFYYQEVLNIKKQPFRPDRIHAIFEPAKNAEFEQVAKGSLLKAGKDLSGKTRHYETAEDLIVNPADITHLRTIHHRRRGASSGTEEKTGCLFYAPEARSSDGMGEDFPDRPQWSAFGHDKLPVPRVGFSVSSAILSLGEGSRTITLTFDWEEETPLEGDTDNSLLKDAFEVYATGEDGWMPLQVRYQDDSDEPYSTLAPGQLKLVTVAGRDAPPIIPYDPDIHDGHYNTGHPVVKILLNPDEDSNKKGAENACKLLTHFAGVRISKISIDTDVKGLKDLSIQNDMGPIDPSKAFHPFGPRPAAGSSFYVGHPELEDKKWEELTLNIDWSNLPADNDFARRYSAYKQQFIEEELTKNNYKDHAKNGDSIVTDNSHFRASVEISSLKGRLREAGDEEGVELFMEESSPNPAEKNLRIRPDGKEENEGEEKTGRDPDADTQKGQLRLKLTTGFYHRLYPQLYAVAMSFDADEGLPLPNEPYTPVIEKLTLDYKAFEEQEIEPDETDEHTLSEHYKNTRIRFFHEEPFGTSEQHLYLKHRLSFLASKGPVIRQLPVYSGKSQFLIGLEGVEPLQTVSLLFRVAEGSENPLNVSESAEISWSVLSHNHWRPLKESHIPGDTTNHFLKSGIIKFLIPREATLQNTLLEAGRIWLKAEIDFEPDGVCDMIDVHANAVEAVFSNRDNDLSHLESALPAGTAEKMKDRPALIKKAEQPYSSFGGRPEETDAHYYVRVSERLRHKQRAVNVWDFEHLMLQKFPEIHKVKCINHTRYDENKEKWRELAPGYISVIVIPDLRNNNAFDPLKPRVSQNKLDEITSFLTPLCTSQAEVNVHNPDYKEIKLEGGVHFREGFDPRFYQGKIKEDITAYLSPWVDDASAGIEFGGEFHLSRLIYFMENLPYVDFLDDITLVDVAEDEKKTVISSDYAAQILVSAPDHDIHIITSEEICS